MHLHIVIICSNRTESCLEFTVGSDGIGRFDSVSAIAQNRFRKLRVRIAVVQLSRHRNIANQTVQIAAGTQYNTAADAADPDTGRVGVILGILFYRTGNLAAGIAIGNHCPGTAHQTADPAILILLIVGNANIDVVDGAAACNTHGCGTNQAAKNTAAPAGASALQVLNGITGHRAVFKRCGIACRLSGKANKAADAVPVGAVQMGNGSSIYVAVKHNIVHIGIHCDTEQAQALGIGSDPDIPNGVCLPIVRRGKVCHNRFGVGTIPLFAVSHTANGGKFRCAAGAADIMALHKTQLQCSSLLT